MTAHGDWSGSDAARGRHVRPDRGCSGSARRHDQCSQSVGEARKAGPWNLQRLSGRPPPYTAPAQAVGCQTPSRCVDVSLCEGFWVARWSGSLPAGTWSLPDALARLREEGFSLGCLRELPKVSTWSFSFRQAGPEDRACEPAGGPGRGGRGAVWGMPTGVPGAAAEGRHPAHLLTGVCTCLSAHPRAISTTREAVAHCPAGTCASRQIWRRRA